MNLNLCICLVGTLAKLRGLKLKRSCYCRITRTAPSSFATRSLAATTTLSQVSKFDVEV